MTRRVSRFVGPPLIVISTAAVPWLVWRYLLPLVDYRVHACIIGLAAFYLGIGDSMAWNSMSNLEKIVTDAKHLTSQKLALLISSVQASRTIILRKLGVIIICKGIAVATAPVVFDKKVSAEVQSILLTAGYIVVFGSFLVLWSIFRNYRESSRFRDELILETRIEEEARKKREQLKLEERHDFEGDPNVSGYYTVLPSPDTEGAP